MKTIEPFSERNAVKVVAFGFNFTSRISDTEMELLIEKLNNDVILSKEFKSNITEEISMTIGPDNVSHQKITKGGIFFNKDDNWIINISKEFIVITCREYSRWHIIAPIVYNYLSNLFQIINNELNQITLEYLDEFKILNTETEWKKELFNIDSKYINQNIYNINDYWHLNQGAFIKINDISHKLLDTISINYFADEQDNFNNKINIRSQHILLFENQEKFNKDIFENYFDKIHKHSKNIFENIINKNIIKEFKEE